MNEPIISPWLIYWAGRIDAIHIFFVVAGVTLNEYALLDKGWVYRSKEEAEAALPAVAKEMGVEYEL